MIKELLLVDGGIRSFQLGEALAGRAQEEWQVMARAWLGWSALMCSRPVTARWSFSLLYVQQWGTVHCCGQLGAWIESEQRRLLCEPLLLSDRCQEDLEGSGRAEQISLLYRKSQDKRLDLDPSGRSLFFLKGNAGPRKARPR